MEAKRLNEQSNCRRIVRKSDLADEGRWLLEDMQRMGHGRYKKLPIYNGQPLVHPPPKRQRDHRPLGPAMKRPAVRTGDYILDDQYIEMFDEFKRIGNGVVLVLEVRDGLPYKMTIDESAAA